jgi:hypothetical protein
MSLDLYHTRLMPNCIIYKYNALTGSFNPVMYIIVIVVTLLYMPSRLVGVIRPRQLSGHFSG